MDIYGLSESDTGEIRYVGKTEILLEARLKEHLWPSSLARPGHKNNWLKELVARGANPVIHSILSMDHPADLDDAEMYMIQHLKGLGCDLTNGTSGGEGLRNPSLEVRGRMSLAKKGKIPYAATLPKSDKTKELIRRARTGTVASLETRSKMSAAHVGVIHSPEAIRKMAQAKLGKKHTPETLARMRIAAQLREQKKRSQSLARGNKDNGTP